jgi:DNA-binding NtrC family response regulator
VCAFPRSTALAIERGELALGRAGLEAAGLVDAEVSTRHAQLATRAGRVELVDVGSRNGTWVDGRRVAAGEPVVLRDGAIVRVGRTLLVYRERLLGGLEPDPPLGAIVSPFGLRAFRAELALLVERRPICVLVRGETGTGKELAAAAVAAALGRPAPVALNLGAVPAGVFESTVFGHVAGAYSGAGQASPGAVGAADRGTLLFDEIGELPLELQPKLLRLLDQGEVQPVGAQRPRRVDVLVIAATHRPLEAMVDEGRFRLDLLARLAHARLDLPALRARPEDTFAVAQALLGERALDETAVEIEAIERLLLADWPMNVRDLHRVVASATARAGQGGLPLWAIEDDLSPASDDVRAGESLSIQAVERALAESSGNESEAARRLGVSRGTLRRFRAARQRGA